MPLWAAAAIMVSCGALILIVMLVGWRRRSRRDAGYVAPLADVSGDVLGEYSGLYVATTTHNEPLNRLVIKHLAFRSKVNAIVTTDGVALVMPGVPTVMIPRDALRGAGRATWTIDRVVETDGLVFITWQVDETTTADSYLRLQSANPAAFLATLDSVLPTTPVTGN